MTRYLPVSVLYLVVLNGAVAAAAPPKVEGSPWLQPDAVESVVEELIHHFKPDAASRKSRFTERLTKRMYSFQDGLRPIYETLPKNEKGHLEMAEVGQALHLLFKRRYQMHLRGLASFGDSDGAAPATKVEEFVQRALQSGLADKGFTNRELSIFAVAIEHLIHEETRGILSKVFSLLSLPQEGAQPKEKVKEAVDTFFVFLLARQDTSIAYDITMDAHRTALQKIESEASPFLTLCRQQLQTRLKSQPDALTFDAALEIAEEMEQGLGTMHQESVCEVQKTSLASTGCNGAGLIPLSSLSSSSSAGSSDALGRQGILEAPPGSEPMAYYANWMLSAANCHVKTDFYTVCCTDPCEAILSNIENEVHASHAKAEHVAPIVALFNKAHSKSPDELRAYLQSSIRDAGSIDIHGTAFAQFLHYAVPCECPHVVDVKDVLPSSTLAPMPHQQEQQEVLQRQPAMQPKLQEKESKQGQQQESKQRQQQEVASSKLPEAVDETTDARKPLFWRYVLIVFMLLVLAFGCRYAIQQRVHHAKYGKLKPRKGCCPDYECALKGIV